MDQGMGAEFILGDRPPAPDSTPPALGKALPNRVLPKNALAMRFLGFRRFLAGRNRPTA